MFQKTCASLLFLLLWGCSGQSALDVTRGLLGYIPPPEETSVSEELQLEYERCKKIGEEPNCAQAAYNVVRKVKGLEPRKVPKGIVIILEGNGGHEDAKPTPTSESQQQDDKTSQGESQQTDATASDQQTKSDEQQKTPGN